MKSRNADKKWDNLHKFLRNTHSILKDSFLDRFRPKSDSSDLSQVHCCKNTFYFCKCIRKEFKLSCKDTEYLAAQHMCKFLFRYQFESRLRISKHICLFYFTLFDENMVEDILLGIFHLAKKFQVDKTTIYNLDYRSTDPLRFL